MRITIDQFKISNYVKKSSYALEYRAPSRIQIAIWGLITLIVLAISLFNYQSHQVGSWQDDTVYTILIRSLVESDRYGIISVPGDVPFPAPYPFGYPLLLAPLAQFFPQNIDILKIPSLLATLVNMAILFWAWPLFTRRSYWWNLAVLTLYAVQPQTIWHTRMVMADPIFITFYLAAMVLAVQSVRGSWNWQRKLLMSFVLTFMIFTRIVGVLFIVGIFIYLLLFDFKKYWKDLFLIPIMMITITGIIISLTSVNVTDLIPERYLKESNATLVLNILGIQPPQFSSSELLPPEYVFGQIVATTENEEVIEQVSFLRQISWILEDHFGNDIREVIISVGGGDKEAAFFENLGVPFFPQVIGYIISIIILAGFIRWFFEEGITVFNLSAIVYLLPLLIWIWDGPRFFYPIQAQLFLGLLMGIEILWLLVADTRIQKISKERIGYGMVLLAVVFIGALLTYKSLNLEDTRVHLGDFRDRTTWITETTVPKSAIIMTESPLLDYTYGGRKTMPYPKQYSPPGELINYLSKYEIGYILVAPKIKWYPEFKPEYSDSAVDIMNLMESSEYANGFERIHSLEEDSIKVYKYTHQ